MKINKCLSVVAVSIVCLGDAAHALTEQWHVALTNSSQQVYSWQAIPDGLGGVACSYSYNSGLEVGTSPVNFTVILWIDSKGRQIYQATQQSLGAGAGNGGGWSIFSFDANHLVYGANFWSGSSTYYNVSGYPLSWPTTTCVLVNKSGAKTTETPIANCFGFNTFSGPFSPQQPLQNDKTGFFVIRFTGNYNDFNNSTGSGNYELVRFSYK